MGRAVVAVVTSRGFLGVCHDESSEPWNLGNVLLHALQKSGGDLGALTTDLVFLNPGGWASYAERRRRRPPLDFDEPELFGPDELRGQAWLSWLYLIDLEQRKLTIYPGNPYLRRDTRLAPLARVTLDDTGRGRPAVFSQPPPPWPGIPVASGWAQDSTEARKVRRRIDRAMSGPDGGASLRASLVGVVKQALSTVDWHEPAALESEAEQALREVLGQPRSDPRKRSVTDADPLCVPFYWDNADRYWEVDLDGWAVRYPPAGVRRLEDPLQLYRLDGCTGTLPPLEPALRRAADRLEHASNPLQRLGRSVGLWQSPADTARRAIDAMVDALTFARGETAGLHWWLLDWIRLGQVPLREDRGQAPFPERNRDDGDAPAR